MTPKAPPQTSGRDRKILPNRQDFKLDFATGLICDVRDSVGKWAPGEVVQKVGSVVTINFLNWDAKWNEQIDTLSSPHRFAPIAHFSSGNGETLPYKLKDEVWVCPLIPEEFPEQWIKGSLCKIDDKQVQVEFAGPIDNRRFQRWFHVSTEEIKPGDYFKPIVDPLPAGFEQEWFVGRIIEVKDTIEKWEPAEILQIDGPRIYITYMNWSKKWNEWIDVSKFKSSRIRLLGAALKPGEQEVTLNYTSPVLYQPPPPPSSSSTNSSSSYTANSSPSWSQSPLFYQPPPPPSSPYTNSSSSSYTTNSSPSLSQPKAIVTPSLVPSKRCSSSLSGGGKAYQGGKKKKESNTYGQSFADRLSGVGSESLRPLTPITGINQTAIVSLSESVAPLQTIIEELDIHVMAAEDFANNYLVDETDEYGLTSDEIGAINLYTQAWIPASNSLYAILNDRLRAEERLSVKPFFSYLKLLLTAMDKLPKQEVTVWRGVKHDLTADYKKGKNLCWWSFSSCTTNVEVLSNDLFLGKSSKRTLFSLTTKSGVEIVKYSMYKTEAEVLLPPGIRLSVMSKLDQGDLQIVQLKELSGRMIS